jgi:hypothetical protein
LFNFSLKEFILSVAANVAAGAIGPIDMIGYVFSLLVVVVLLNNWLSKRTGPSWKKIQMIFGFLVMCTGCGIGIYGMHILASGKTQLSPTASVPSPFTGLSNPQLRMRTVTLARALRDLENPYDQKINDLGSQSYFGSTPEERAIRAQERNAAIVRTMSEKTSEYRKHYHIETNQIYEELCRRLNLLPADPANIATLPQTGLTQREYLGITVMRTGMMAGSRPMNLVADTLERLASAL